MTDKSRSVSARGHSRQDRLKAALKANVGRRKAQARARQAADRADEPAADDVAASGRTEQAGPTGARKED